MADADRRYICTGCESIVRARWSGSASFFVGCDCTSVPIVPQMGQAETPTEWRVERPDCCSDVDVSDLEIVYGGESDYRCPECGAHYGIDGAMVRAPDVEPTADDNTTLSTFTEGDQTDG